MAKGTGNWHVRAFRRGLYFKVYGPNGTALKTEEGHARQFNTHKAALAALREHEHKTERPWNRIDGLIDEGDTTA
ncbi:MAG: hypothetical protein AAF674_12155 [Pseudomonadota bacterium]